MQNSSVDLRRLSARDTVAGDPGGSIRGVNTFELPDGAICWCTETQCDYQLRRYASTVADGLYVVQPSAGPGRWFQQQQVGFGTDVLTQSAWFVNATTGDDANDGATSATALLTLAELYRRTRGALWAVDSTITLSGDFSAEQLVLTGMTLPDVHLIVRGTVSAPAVSGAVAAFTAWNAATTTLSLFDDGGVTDYSLHIGKFIRMTSGPASGATAVIVESVAPGQCRTGKFMFQDGFTANPAAGNTFVVEEYPTQLGGCDVSGLTGQGGDLTTFAPRLMLREVTFDPGLTQKHDMLFGNAFQVGTYLYRVAFVGAQANIGFGQCNLIGCYNSSTLAFFGTLALVFGHASSAAVTVLYGAQIHSVVDWVHWGLAARLIIGVASRFSSAQPDGYFEVAGFAAVSVDVNGTYQANRIWGAAAAANTTTTGIAVFTGGKVAYTVLPTVTGASPGVNDVTIGGDAMAYAAVPFAQIDPAKGWGAAIVPYA